MDAEGKVQHRNAGTGDTDAEEKVMLGRADRAKKVKHGTA